jgi:hypothetical protein
MGVYSERVWIAKVTRLYRGSGKESEPENANFDAAYLRFPLAHEGQWAWRVYLPMHGFEATGPWYLWRDVTEDLVHSLGRSVPIRYHDGELWAHLPPGPGFAERADEFGKGQADLLDLQERLNQMNDSVEQHMRLSMAEDLLPLDELMRRARHANDPEWPEVFYLNPSDWFDDNQVIDG